MRTGYPLSRILIAGVLGMAASGCGNSGSADSGAGGGPNSAVVTGGAAAFGGSQPKAGATGNAGSLFVESETVASDLAVEGPTVDS